MSNDIRVGTNGSMTVAEAARADDGLILGAGTDDDRDANERANRSLAAFAREDGDDR